MQTVLEDFSEPELLSAMEMNVHEAWIRFAHGLGGLARLLPTHRLTARVNPTIHGTMLRITRGGGRELSRVLQVDGDQVGVSERELLEMRSER